MVIPPRFVKDAKVWNTTDEPVVVCVQFGSERQCEDGLKFILEEKTIQPNGGVVIFESKEYDRGSWTEIAPVHTVFVGDTTRFTPEAKQGIESQEFRIQAAKGENDDDAQQQPPPPQFLIECISK